MDQANTINFELNRAQELHASLDLVYSALKEKGYKIPQDVSLIGFDDIPYSSISSPTLTTIHEQRNIMGKQSVIQLMQLIEDPRFMPMKTQITGRLVVRSSVKDLTEAL